VPDPPIMSARSTVAVQYTYLIFIVGVYSEERIREWSASSSAGDTHD